MREGNGTKFTIDRKIFSSDIWHSSPWKLKIWIYLIGRANYTDNKFMGIEVKRGQLIRSYRTIAKDCAYKIGYRQKKPSVKTVRRICEELTKDGRITLRRTHTGTLFTISNYNKLQPFPKPRTPQRMLHEGNSRETVGKHSKNDYKNVKEKTYKYTPDDLRLTKKLKENILQINPGHIFRGEAWEEKNAEQIRLMRQYDKRASQDIEAIIDFAFKDKFWSGVIQSVFSLRKNYDMMKAQMGSKYEETETQRLARELRKKAEGRKND